MVLREVHLVIRAPAVIIELTSQFQNNEMGPKRQSTG